MLDGSDPRDGVGAIAAALRLRRAAAGWASQIDRPEQRLTDAQIAACRRMSAALVVEIAERLGIALDAHDPRATALAAGLRRSADAALILLARQAEHETAEAAPEVDPPVEAPDAATAALLDALVLAEARRRDRFGGPVIPFAELSTELRRWAAWDVAARLCEAGDAEPTDPAVARAVHAMLLASEAGMTAPALAARLAAMLDERGRLDDRAGLAALASGQGALFAAMLARRAGVGSAAVWQAALAGTQEFLDLARRAGWSETAIAALADIVAATASSGPIGAAPARDLPAAAIDSDLEAALARVMSEPRS